MQEDIEFLRYSHEQGVECTFLSSCAVCQTIERVEKAVSVLEHEAEDERIAAARRIEMWPLFSRHRATEDYEEVRQALLQTDPFLMDQRRASAIEAYERIADERETALSVAAEMARRIKENQKRIGDLEDKVTSSLRKYHGEEA